MQNVLRVLIHFFRQVEADRPLHSEEKKLLAELDRFGVSLGELEKTLAKIAQWVGVQVDTEVEMEELQYPIQAHRGTRFYCPREMNKISKKSIGFIIKMEQIGVLTDTSRECVIDQLMQLPEGDALLPQTKWITFQTLFHGAPPAHLAYLEWLLFGRMAGAH